MHYGFVLNDEFIWSYAVKHSLDCYHFITQEDDSTLVERDDMETPERVLKHIVKELGLLRGQLRLVQIFHDGEEDRFISFCTNCRMHRFPSDEHVRRVQELLAEKEPPKWYLDLEKVEWHL